MSTLETQYRKFLEANQKLKISFEEWKKVNARLIKQALINMMKDDEELGLYDEPTKCYCGHTTTCDCGPEEPKQSAVEIYNEFMNKDYLGVRVTTEDRIIHAMEAYKLQSNKAKWQQERSYSEEDFKLFARQFYREIKLDNSNLLWEELADKCLEQFKNK